MRLTDEQEKLWKELTKTYYAMRDCHTEAYTLMHSSGYNVLTKKSYEVGSPEEVLEALLKTLAKAHQHVGYLNLMVSKICFSELERKERNNYENDR